MADWQMHDPWPDHRFETVSACLYCSSRRLSPFLSGVRDWYFEAVPGEFGFARCDECGSLVLTRRPRAEDVHLAYAHYYTHSVAAERTGGMAWIAWRRLVHGYATQKFCNSKGLQDRACAAIMGLLPRRRLDLDCWYRFLPSRPSRVFDFGCGNGDFLQRAEALGHAAVGTDFDEAAVALARSQGLDARPLAALEEADLTGSFDLVTINHVIEHVADPAALLARVSSWLVPGGRLFLETPNAEAAGLARWGALWRGLEAPRHFSIASRAALQRALRGAGFGRIDWYERRSVAAELDDQARSLRQAGVTAGVGTFASPAQQGAEFLTLVAHADG